MREVLTKYWSNLIVVALTISALVWVYQRSQRTGVRTGKVVPDVVFKLLDESPDVSLSSLKGKPVVLDFWQSWCGPCKRSLPHFDSLAARYEGKAHFIAVNSGNEELSMQARLKDQLRLTLPIATNGRRAAGMFDIDAIPSTVVLDGEGRLVERFIGSVPMSSLEAVLQPMIAR